MIFVNQVRTLTGIRSLGGCLFLLLGFAVIPDLNAQILGTVQSGTDPVPFAHVHCIDRKTILVCDRNGQFLISNPKCNQIVASAIGFRSDTIDINNTGVEQSLTIDLQSISYDLAGATIREKELSAKDILKRAKKNARKQAVKGDYWVEGIGGEYSMDDGRFVFAVEGKFRAKEFYGPKTDLWIEEVFASENKRTKTQYNTLGIDFPFVARQGDPQKLISRWALNCASKDQLIPLEKGFALKIIAANSDSTRIADYLIRLSDYALLSASERWPFRKDTKPMKSVGGSYYEHVLTSGYHFEYHAQGEGHHLLRADFEHHILFYEALGSRDSLDHKRVVTVCYDFPKRGAKLDSKGVPMKNFSTLERIKGLPKQSWEDKVLPEQSEFLDRVLKDLKGE